MLSLISKALVHCLSIISKFSLDINFYFQFFTYILILGGDIETNPGPDISNVLDIIHLNIRSIRNKIAFLNTFVHDFDILCFTETHLDNAISNEVLILDGFNCILRKDRNSFGGGVMIYMSNMLRANRRFELEPQDTECIWIEIENLTFNYLLCCIYRPPNADSRFWHNISWSIEKAQEISDNIIIVGDLNVDFLNIPRNHQIREILSSNNLVNKIREPTRISNTTRTLIEIFLMQRQSQ